LKAFPPKGNFLLAKKYAIDMPITEQTYKVLYEAWLHGQPCKIYWRAGKKPNLKAYVELT